MSTSSDSHGGRFVPRVGAIVAGKYRIERKLGEGGMGLVVAASHLSLGGQVALKFLLSGDELRQDAVTRFTREAQSVARIKNEHVARVLDMGTLDSGDPFIVMELLEGLDLHKFVRKRYVSGCRCRRVRAASIRGSRRSACDGHRASGSQTRELVSLSQTGWFAVRPRARLRNREEHSRKQRSGRRESDRKFRRARVAALHVARADTKSEGSRSASRRVVDGRHPLQATHGARGIRSGQSFGESGDDRHGRADAFAAAFRPDAPPELEAVIHRCLEKKLDRRFQNVDELACALLPFAPMRPRGRPWVPTATTTFTTTGASFTTDGRNVHDNGRNVHDNGRIDADGRSARRTPAAPQGVALIAAVAGAVTALGLAVIIVWIVTSTNAKQTTNRLEPSPTPIVEKTSAPPTAASADVVPTRDRPSSSAETQAAAPSSTASTSPVTSSAAPVKAPKRIDRNTALDDRL